MGFLIFYLNTPTSITRNEVKTLKGKVTKWLDQRGYGFISSEGHSSEIFVHSS
ncbi:cold shock domain-containing protein, partial [Candidatus Bathyarchaeota archaeon]|nr:cold shock domain-containing protein [Candidatus Bathyarchaeota archaeon]